jgi:hypothetical protein
MVGTATKKRSDIPEMKPNPRSESDLSDPIRSDSDFEWV